jgi:hypothetical protein
MMIAETPAAIGAPSRIGIIFPAGHKSKGLVALPDHHPPVTTTVAVIDHFAREPVTTRWQTIKRQLESRAAPASTNRQHRHIIFLIDN